VFKKHYSVIIHSGKVGKEIFFNQSKNIFVMKTNLKDFKIKTLTNNSAFLRRVSATSFAAACMKIERQEVKKFKDCISFELIKD